VAGSGPDGDDDADRDDVGVTERLGVDDVAGEVRGVDDAALAGCDELAATVGGAVVRRCVGVGAGAGVVTTPTMVGAGFAGGRTCRYVASVSRNSMPSTTVDIRTRWRIAITSRPSAVRCRGRPAG
jgi:hypothetical protein